jgi:hypothetical protein
MGFRASAFTLATGNVGIGDSTFAAGKLQVYDSSANHIWLKGRASDGTASISFRNNADNTYNGRIQVADTGGMLFQVAGSTRATLDASGNLLVGGTDAAYDGTKLITGSYSATSAGLSILTSSSGAGYLLFGDGTGANGYVGQINYNHSLNRMAFNTNSVERMAIDAGGNLLLGVNFQINAGFQCIQFNGTTHNGLVLKTTRADINSTFAAFVNSAGAGCGSISQNGTTTVNYAASSDRRLKENILDSDDSGLVIDAIQVRKFDWIGTNEHERYGFIAQELQEVVPVAVCSIGMPDEEDPMLGVDPSKLMALAIKEIQSLRARIAILEGA